MLFTDNTLHNFSSARQKFGHRNIKLSNSIKLFPPFIFWPEGKFIDKVGWGGVGSGGVGWGGVGWGWGGVGVGWGIYLPYVK